MHIALLFIIDYKKSSACTCLFVTCVFHCIHVYLYIYMYIYIFFMYMYMYNDMHVFVCECVSSCVSM